MLYISDNNHLTFRGNSIATKSMEAHMKLVGDKVTFKYLYFITTVNEGAYII